LRKKNAKAVVDTVLGAIAITAGKRDLQGYIGDMRNRGQDEDRIAEVTAALKPYADWYSPDKIVKSGSV